MRSRHAAHGVGVVAVELLAVGAGRTRVALRQGIDVGALGGARRRGERDRLRHRLARHAVARLVDRQVVVRPGGEGDPPPGHGAAGIEPRRLAKRADRLVVVEAVDQAQALVEVALRLGARGGDGMAVGAETVEHGRAIRRRWRVVAVVTGGPGDAGRDDEEQDDERSKPHPDALRSHVRAVDAGGSQAGAALTPARSRW